MLLLIDFPLAQPLADVGSRSPLLSDHVEDTGPMLERNGISGS